MSFKYRTVGYSPEYATTTGSTTNEFHNPNNFMDGSVVTFEDNSLLIAESGADILVSSGATLKVTDAPTTSLDVTNLSYVTTQLALKLNLVGGTLTGALTLSGAPTIPLHAATKAYADLMLPLTGGTLTGALVLNGAPTLPLHAATKAYADLMLPLTGGTLTSGDLILANHPSEFSNGKIAATKAYVDARLGIFNAGAGIGKASTTSTPITGTYAQSGAEITVTTSVSHGYSKDTLVTITFSGDPVNDPIDGAYSIVTLLGPTGFALAAEDTATRAGTVSIVTTVHEVFVDSTTLTVNADGLDLTVLHDAGLFLEPIGAAAYSDTAWYDKVKVDEYGRVISGKNTPLVNAADGTFNKVTISGGYITYASNEEYLTENDEISLTGDVVGSGTTAISTTLSVIDGLNAGTYSKVTVNTKGRVTAASQLSASDISNALGYTPPRDTNIRFLHLKSGYQALSWGSSPANLVVAGSDNWPMGSEGFSVSGQYLYVPKGVYQVIFYGTSNWWHGWYGYWWNGDWWNNYSSYYYNPSMIEVNGVIQSAAFSNYGGWWWYWNRQYSYPDKSQDFCLTDTYYLPSNGYMRFYVPHLYGCTYWYNVKVVKLR